MDKNQTPRGAFMNALSNLNRKFFAARFFRLVLYLALILTSIQTTASAQNCADQCQQAYVQCLASMVDPAICDDRYEACFVGCM